MAKHQVTLSPNASSSAESAPFLGHYLSLGDAKWDDFVAEVCSDSGLKSTMVESILNFVFEQIYILEQQGLYMLHFPGGFAAYVSLTGGFPTADAAFDPEKNAVVVSFKLDSDLANLLADIVPTIVTDATSTKVKITSVADEAMPKPYEIIHGCAPFDASGWNLKMTDAGANAYLLTATGVKKPCLSIASPKPGQVESFRSLELLPGGDYKFCIDSRGGDSEGVLQSTTKNVKFMAIGVAPLVPSDKNMIIDKLTAPLSKNAAVAIAGNKIAAHSTTDGGISAISLKLSADASAVAQTYTVAANGKAINIASLNCGSAAAGSYPNAKLIFTYQKAGAEGATESLEMGVTVVISGPSVTKVTTSLGDNKARYNLAATVTGTNLSAVKKISYHFFNDQSEECDTDAMDCEMTCSADGTTLTISALPDTTSSHGIPQGTWDFSFYNEGGSYITSINNVEYVPA